MLALRPKEGTKTGRVLVMALLFAADTEWAAIGIASSTLHVEGGSSLSLAYARHAMLLTGLTVRLPDRNLASAEILLLWVATLWKLPRLSRVMSRAFMAVSGSIPGGGNTPEPRMERGSYPGNVPGGVRSISSSNDLLRVALSPFLSGRPLPGSTLQPNPPRVRSANPISGSEKVSL